VGGEFTKSQENRETMKDVCDIMGSSLEMKFSKYSKKECP